MVSIDVPASVGAPPLNKNFPSHPTKWKGRSSATNSSLENNFANNFANGSAEFSSCHQGKNDLVWQMLLLIAMHYIGYTSLKVEGQ